MRKARRRWTVDYTMADGREVTRRFASEAEAMTFYAALTKRRSPPIAQSLRLPEGADGRRR